MAATKNQTDREIDLEKGRTVSLDEAIDALQSIRDSAETIAHRVKAERDDTALLILGQVGKGEKCTSLEVEIGNNLEMAAIIALAMKENPRLRVVIEAAVNAVTTT